MGKEWFSEEGGIGPVSSEALTRYQSRFQEDSILKMNPGPKRAGLIQINREGQGGGQGRLPQKSSDPEETKEEA